MPQSIIFALLLCAASPEQELPPGDSPATEEEKAKEKESGEPDPGQTREDEGAIDKSPSVLTPPPGETPKDEEEPEAPLAPQAEDFFQFSDFVDTRVTFA